MYYGTTRELCELYAPVKVVILQKFVAPKELHDKVKSRSQVTFALTPEL